MKSTQKNKKKQNITRKNRDISIIKKINRDFENKLDTKLISKLNKEFKKRMIHEETTIPSLFKKYSYYSKINKGDNYLKYYIIDLNKNHTCILDLDKIGKAYSFFSVSNILFSNNENFLIYSVDTIGNRYHDVYVKSFFEDDITKILSNVEGDIQLSVDDKYLYYLNMNKSMRPNRLFRYDLEKKIHKNIYTENDETFSLSLSKSTDRNHILLTSFSWESSHVFHIIDDSYKLLYKKEKDLFYSVDTFNDTWYIMYTKNNDSKIVYTSDYKKYSTLLPNKENLEYNDLFIKSHYLCCVYKENGLNHLLAVDLLSNKIQHFRYDNISTSFSIPFLSNLDLCSPKIIINLYSNLQPKKTIELNFTTNKISVLKVVKINGYDESKYKEKILQVNKKLCITMLYKKDKLKKNMKCVLNGYGAYGTVDDPVFDSKAISLLDRGFIFCTAHVRGGGFHGSQWHKDGKLLKKINTFTDFIDCTKYLINNKYTSREKIAIWGRSAGGLLIGAVLNMEPELYKLAILGVPFVDVTNTMKDTSKPLTTEEYKEWGNPNIKKYGDYIKKYDPIINIDTKAKYPNIYIYSNLEDTLVEYKEPLNYYMKIKHADVFKNKERNLMMHINLKYGHMQSSKRYEGLNEFGVYYSLIINQLK